MSLRPLPARPSDGAVRRSRRAARPTETTCAAAEIGVKRWRHDLWIKIIRAAIDGHPDQVALDWHPALTQPAAMRYSASSPALLSRLKEWNAGKPYHEQVRPFGFLLAYMPRTGLFAMPAVPEVAETPKRGRPRKTPRPKPIAPYNSNPQRALSSVFDRDTGRPVEIHELKTYAEVLARTRTSKLEPDSSNNGRRVQFMSCSASRARSPTSTFVLGPGLR